MSRDKNEKDLSLTKSKPVGEQGILAVAKDGAVPSPGVFIQFFDVSRQPRSQRVQMDVPDQFQEIRIFLTYNGFVSVLKKVANSSMALVEGNGISGHKPTHDLAERGRTGS